MNEVGGIVEHVMIPEKERVSPAEIYWQQTRDEIVLLNKDLKVLTVNPAFCEFFGKEEDEFLGKEISTIGSKRFRQFINDSIQAGSLDGRSYIHSYRDRESGEKKWHKWELQQNKDTVFVTGKDITNNKEEVDKLYDLLNHDEMTGLYSLHFINEMKKVYKERGYPLSVLSLDADGLKVFNDACGHKDGDSLLKFVSAFLKGVLRDGEIIARVGGDEFNVLLPQVSLEKMKVITDRINYFRNLINSDQSEISEEDKLVLKRIRKNFNKLNEEGILDVEDVNSPVFEKNGIRVPLLFSMGESERGKVNDGNREMYEEIGSVFKRADEVLVKNKGEKRIETITIFLDLMDKLFPEKKTEEALKVFARLKTEKEKLLEQKQKSGE